MLQLEKIHYRYHRSQPWALENISLSLERGSFHLLTGPSGAGKTTLFRLLTLNLLPEQGTLIFDGENISQISRHKLALLRRKMGVVYQDFRLLPHLTVRENIELPLVLHGKLTNSHKQAVKEILDWVGLTPLADKPAAELSGGEQQRTAIARAVVHQPELLIADEPTGNIDPAMSRKVLHLFSELHRHGTTVVVATHDVGLFKSQKFPIIYLNNGQLAEPEESE